MTRRMVLMYKYAQSVSSKTVHVTSIQPDKIVRLFWDLFVCVARIVFEQTTMQATLNLPMKYEY